MVPVPRLLLMTLWLSLACGAAAGQEKTKVQPPAGAAKTTAGRETFLRFCASCHGTGGHGDGPVVFSLQTPPPDLTTLAKRHGGKYPAGYVSAVINFGRSFASHGAEDMPVWGSRFGNLDPVHDPTGQQHVDNLVTFIQSLQTK